MVALGSMPSHWQKPKTSWSEALGRLLIGASKLTKTSWTQSWIPCRPHLKSTAKQPAMALNSSRPTCQYKQDNTVPCRDGSSNKHYFLQPWLLRSCATLRASTSRTWRSCSELSACRAGAFRDRFCQRVQEGKGIVKEDYRVRVRSRQFFWGVCPELRDPNSESNLYAAPFCVQRSHCCWVSFLGRNGALLLEVIRPCSQGPMLMEPSVRKAFRT